MRSPLLKILTILILILIFFTSCGKQDELTNQNVNMKKVNRFIKDITKSMKNKEIIDYTKKIESYEFTDDEYIEIQKKLSKGMDNKYFNNEINLNKLDKYSTRFAILFLFKTNALSQWKQQYTNEEIVVDKIIPIIDYDSDVLKVLWLHDLSLLLMDINNQKLPFSDENRINTSSTLVNIIINKQNKLTIKFTAFKAWIFCERRKEIVNMVFYKVLEDDELFGLTGRLFWFLTNVEPKIYDLMLNILEENNKYSKNQLIGALDFFRHDLGMKAGNRIDKLISALVNIRDNEDRIHENEKIEIILKCLENRKKDGD